MASPQGYPTSEAVAGAMPIVKVLSISGEELIARISLDPGEKIQQLANQAAEALGVKRCKLTTRDGLVLPRTATVQESKVQDGDSLVAVAIPLSEAMIQICELLTEYYRLLCQHTSGDYKPLKAKLDVCFETGKFPNASLQSQTEAMGKNLESAIHHFRELQRLSDDLVEGHGSAIELVKKLEMDLQEQANSKCSWGCKMVLPPGLLEFYDVAAQAGLLAGDMKLGELGIEIVDIVDTWGEAFFTGTESGGALAKFGELGFDDDAVSLCMEFRQGKDSRYVVFHHWEDDTMDEFRYSFSDPEPPSVGDAEGKGADLMADEGPMSHTRHITRTAIFASFTELLQGLVADASSKKEPSFPDGAPNPNFIPRPFPGRLVFGMGGWQKWDRDLDL